MYSRERSLREDRVPQRRKTPSFSSSLLDAIYRSIDDESNGDEEFAVYRETAMRKKQSATTFKQEEGETLNLQRAIMIEKWKENQRIRTSTVVNSTSTSSDSSSGGAFSSSEAESNYRGSSTSSCFTPRRPKPVRTGISAQSDRSEKPKHEGGFTKTKLRALKMYGDLKKAKHPISPGRRIASFLNSLFNAKKEKVCSVDAMEDMRPERKSKLAQASTCSSASSFSRSCLSKTPSSRGKVSNGMKRSVRFYPVSVIVGEDCRPCGHKSLYEDDPSLMPIPSVKKIAATPSLNKELKKKDAMDKNGRVKSAAQDLVRGYQEKSMNKFKFRDFRVEDDDDEDADSYASSDLFELENLIGIGRYREELPVYETTNLKTNQAIANGFIL